MVKTKRWMLMGPGLALVLAMPFGVMAQEAAPTDPALLLKAIPADATAFVALRDLTELDKDVHTLWQNLKLPEGVVPNLVELLSGSLQLGETFNPTGSIAAVILNLSEVKTPDEIEGRIAIFFPAKDAEAMAKAMGGEKDGETLKLELGGKPMVAAAKDGFLVMSPSEEGLKAAMQTKGGVIGAFPADRQKLFAQADVYGWGNFRGVSKELRAALMEAIEEALNNIMMGAMANDKSSLESIEQLMAEGQEAGFAIALKPAQGLSAQFFMVMQPDTKLGKDMAAMKPTDKPLLVGLPGEPTILAVGTVASPNTGEQIKKMFDNLLGTEGIEESVDKDKLTQIRDMVVPLADSMQQASIGISGLPAGGEDGMMALTVVGEVKNSQEFKSKVKDLVIAVKDLAIDAAKKGGEDEEKVKAVSDAFAWKENAEKVGDASVDHFTLDVAKLPDGDAETVDQVKKILGKEGALLRVASVGQNRVVVTLGGGAKRFEQIAGLASKGESPLSAHADVKKVADRLPAGPKLAEGYLNLEHMFTLIMDISNEMGGGFPFPIALRNAAPIALTVTKAGDTGQQVEVLLPVELLRSVADMVRPLMGMMMGGPGGGPPGEPTEPQEEGKLE